MLRFTLFLKNGVRQQKDRLRRFFSRAFLLVSLGTQDVPNEQDNLGRWTLAHGSPLHFTSQCPSLILRADSNKNKMKSC